MQKRQAGPNLPNPDRAQQPDQATAATQQPYGQDMSTQATRDLDTFLNEEIQHQLQHEVSESAVQTAAAATPHAHIQTQAYNPAAAHQHIESGTRPKIITADEQNKAFRSAQRHTTRVKWLKWLLPIGALATIVGFVTWVIDQNPQQALPQVEIAETSFEKDELVMADPKLNGFTDGRAYEVTAKRAVQKVATPHVINLEQIAAQISDEKDQWAKVAAQTGQFDQTKETLALNGMVDVSSSLGYALTTDGAFIEMKKGYLKTTSPVQIESKDIILAADQLEAMENGAQFRFSGRVKLRIDPALMNKAQSKRATQTQNQAPAQEVVQ